MYKLLAFVNAILGGVTLLTLVIPKFMNLVPADRASTLNEVVGVIGGTNGAPQAWLSTTGEHGWAVLTTFGIILLVNSIILFKASRD